MVLRTGPHRLARIPQKKTAPASAVAERRRAELPVKDSGTRKSIFQCLSRLSNAGCAIVEGVSGGAAKPAGVSHGQSVTADAAGRRPGWVSFDVVMRMFRGDRVFVITRSIIAICQPTALRRRG